MFKIDEEETILMIEVFYLLVGVFEEDGLYCHLVAVGEGDEGYSSVDILRNCLHQEPTPRWRLHPSRKTPHPLQTQTIIQTTTIPPQKVTLPHSQKLFELV